MRHCRFAVRPRDSGELEPPRRPAVKLGGKVRETGTGRGHPEHGQLRRHLEVALQRDRRRALACCVRDVVVPINV